MKMIKVSPKNKGRTRTLKVGDVTLRTCDKTIDLHEDWLYRQQMIELASEHRVAYVDLRSGKFRACAITISIVVNPATTDALLLDYAHECAHIGFQHTRLGFTRHRMEYETESYSIAYLQSQGIAIDPKWIADGRRYVAYIIQMAIDRKIKRFDREAWEFADPSQLHESRQSSFVGFTPELYDGSKDNGFREAMAALELKINGLNSNVLNLSGADKMQSVTVNSSEMIIHPIAEMFPALSETEFTELVEDIRQYGLLSPVTVDENGHLIDGRHRVRACEVLGIPVTTITFTGTEDQKREHSRSLNVHRRHLTPSQRAMRAADAVTVEHGSNQYEQKVDGAQAPSTFVTAEQAAKVEKVSTDSVKRAKTVKRRGVAELEAAVWAGTVSVAVAAKISKLPRKQQYEAIAKGFKVPSAVAKATRTTAMKPSVQEESQPVAVESKKPFDMFVELWNSVSVESQPELRLRIAEYLSLAEPSSKVIPGVLFADGSRRKTATDVEFESFWKAYPRKTNKVKAREAFDKAFKLLRETKSIEETMLILLNGVDAYTEHADPEFMCHPTTWLNGGRWDDEHESIGKGKPKAKNSNFGEFNPETADDPW